MMIRDADTSSKTQLVLLQALQKRGVLVRRIAKTNLRVVYSDRHEDIMIKSYSWLVPYTIGLILSDKFLVRRMLQHHEVPVVAGQSFDPDDVFHASEYAKLFRYNVIIRLTDATIPVTSQSRFGTKEAFENAYRESGKYNCRLLVEKYVSGVSVRCFISKNGYMNILTKKTPVLMGDGISPLRAILLRENIRRAAVDRIFRYPITMSEDRAKKYGITWQSVVPRGKRIRLEECAKLSEGAQLHDVTHRYAWLRPVAKTVLGIFSGASYVALDIMVKPDRTFFVTEVYHSPGPNAEYPMVDENNGTKEGQEMLADLLMDSLLKT